MTKKDEVAEAIASIEAKVGAVSGNPPDLTEELAVIRDAAGVKEED